MYFSTKSYLKSTRNHTAKLAINSRGSVLREYRENVEENNLDGIHLTMTKISIASRDKI